MMAMKYLDKDLAIGEDLEIDLWREGNLVEVYGTSRYGLAFSAAVRGFLARVTSNTGGIDYVNHLIPAPEGLNRKVLYEQFDERKARCRRLGVLEKQEPITGERICTALLQNHVPLIVTKTPGDHEEHLPHWVVVTGFDDTAMYINDPQDTDPVMRTIGRNALQEFIGYRGCQSMVEIWKLERMPGHGHCAER
jgi:hypothetical protein